MSSKFGAVFGSFLALLLLALFAAATFHWIYQIIAADGAEVKRSAGYIYVLTTVAGLVSALVIAQLTVTSPGAVRSIAGYAPESRGAVITLNTIVAIYLIVWTLTGLSALVVGVMLYDSSANRTIADLGTTWLGLAVSAAYAYFGISPAAGNRNADRALETKLRAAPLKQAATNVVDALQKRIANGRITFDAGNANLEDQLLGRNSGQRVTPKLQSFVLALCDKSPKPIRISDLLRASGDSHHAAGRAVDIGNEEIAPVLLPLVATEAEVKALELDEIIFDAAVAGQSDRNRWNFDVGEKHDYDTATLDQHKNHMHFAVLA